jgi:alkanesulfonate monooxygenase SsuD/methylene tetrahydromethanopterin reductase-like flavin-dependent oxidoreductase (luciferase family)
MKIGVVFPQTDIGQDPAMIRDYAQAVEAMGYTHILAFDSVVGANPDRPGGWDSPYTYRHAFHEPFALFAFCAAVTRRIGEKIHDRGRRIEEQLEVMRLLWTRELVSYECRWHRVPDAGIKPLPVQQPIPVWMGGESEAVFRRAARLADGWITLQTFRPGPAAQHTVDRLLGLVRDAGRDPATFGIEGRVALAQVPPEARAKELAPPGARCAASPTCASTRWARPTGPRGARENARALQERRPEVAARARPAGAIPANR